MRGLLFKIVVVIGATLVLQDEVMTPLVPSVTTADCRNLKSAASLQTLLSGYLPNLVFRYLSQHLGTLLGPAIYFF